MMTRPYVIAEAAQGYMGSPEIMRLLIDGVAAAKADAIKFQVVYAEDLCVPGYEHYELFRTLDRCLEMEDAISALSPTEFCDYVSTLEFDIH